MLPRWVGRRVPARRLLTPLTPPPATTASYRHHQPHRHQLQYTTAPIAAALSVRLPVHLQCRRAPAQVRRATGSAQSSGAAAAAAVRMQSSTSRAPDARPEGAQSPPQQRPAPDEPQQKAIAYIAMQQYGADGRRIHYTLAPTLTSISGSSLSSLVGASPLVSHRLCQSVQEVSASNAQQKLLRALFGAGRTYSPRLYPLASLLMVFLPQHYPESVNAFYLTYSKWVFVGSVFGTASSVLSMQCLLVSLGLGAAALPVSAAINWVLKDGLGQLGGMLFASVVSTRFDLSPIRYRLLSAVVLDLSVLLEIFTPLVPALFLPLASLANIGKNIAWLGASASRAAIHRSFLKRENLADITAKSGSQTILASLVGTGVGIGLSFVTGQSIPMILACFLVLSAGHLMATYRALKRVVINHLTEPRVNTLAVHYLTATPSKEQVHLLPPPSALQRMEPLFWLQQPQEDSPAPGASSSPPSAASLFPPAWSASSIDFAPGFDQVVAQVVTHPQMHFEPKGNPGAPSDGMTSTATSDTSAAGAYHTWLDQFRYLPFVAALELSTDAREIARWTGQLSWLRAQQLAWKRAIRQWKGASPEEEDAGGWNEEGRYTRVPVVDDAPAARSSPPHLHIRLLYKATATPDDILRSMLYAAAVRQQWQQAQQRLAEEEGASAAAAPDSIDLMSRVRAIHLRALTLMADDLIQTVVVPNENQPPTTTREPVDGSGTGAQEHARLRAEQAEEHLKPMRSSAFVGTLRASGYATENHFVQDNNTTRITLQLEATTKGVDEA